MLKNPDKFLPVAATAGLSTQVSTTWNGDFRVRQGDELYLNPYHGGHRFFRVAASEVFQGSVELEAVRSRELLKNLLEAKNSYIRLYLEYTFRRPGSPKVHLCELFFGVKTVFARLVDDINLVQPGSSRIGDDLVGRRSVVFFLTRTMNDNSHHFIGFIELA